jgi:hypothetical protein
MKRKSLKQPESLINQFSGDEIVSKFEFLKVNTIGKLRVRIFIKGITVCDN